MTIKELVEATRLTGSRTKVKREQSLTMRSIVEEIM
jgi:hypothetical protein